MMYLCARKEVWQNDGLQVTFQANHAQGETPDMCHVSGNMVYSGSGTYRPALAAFVVGNEYADLPVCDSV